MKCPFIVARSAADQTSRYRVPCAATLSCARPSLTRLQRIGKGKARMMG